MFGIGETGEYHKWKQRRKNPNLPKEFLDSLSVLIVGGGSAGKRHLMNTKGLGIMNVSVVDPRDDRRAEIMERFGDSTATYATEEKAYAENTYNAVIVANPPVFHIESATRAVKAGAHVLVEKNISHQVAGVEEFLKMADANNRIVAVCCMYRFYDTLQYIKNLLTNRALGKLFSSQITFSEYMGDWHPWEKPADFYSSQKKLGGSELYGENHTIDFARWFFGEVTKVFSYVRRLADVTVDADDLAEITCVHESGVITQIHQDAFGRKHRKDMWITGEKGTVFWDSYMGGNRVEWYNADTGRTEVFVGKKSRNDAFTDLLADFLECVKIGRQPVINGWEALKTLKATAVAEQSSKENGKFVAVL